MDVRRVIIRIEANDVGAVYDVAKRLREKGLPGRPRVVPDRENRLVTVEGATVEDVRLAMRRYVAAYGKGHGGYRFNYTVEEVVISEREAIEAAAAQRFGGQIDALRRDQAARDEKWGNERRGYLERIRSLEGRLGSVEARYREAEEAAGRRSDELRGAWEEVAGLRGELAALERMPLRKLLALRLGRWLRRGRGRGIGHPAPSSVRQP